MMPEPAQNVLNEALKLYDEQRWFILPTDPGAKKPYYGFTYKDRYGDRLPSREEVEAWPEWNAKSVRLGARTGAVSGIIVLDVDSQEAHEFVKNQGHPIGPMVQSPREGGGLHIYFKHPGFYVKSTVAVGGVEGLDIRGDYGIVVLPPSIDHKAGRSYEWIIPPEDVRVPEAPAWLVELLEKQASSKERLDVPKIMAGVPEGQRDSALNRLAGKFRYMNLPEDVAVPMIELAAENCKPPFNKAEARAKVKWAYTHYQPGEEIGPVLNTQANSTGEDKTFGEVISATDLMAQEFPAVKWTIPGLLPEGTMIFAGKPKMGKSWMALGFCIAVATGGRALEEFECDIGNVLYLALEDNPRRLQIRMKELLQSRALGDKAPDRLDLKFRAKKLDDGLLQEIEEWLDAHPEARLVVIDTLGSVRGKSSDRRTLYEQDYEVGAALTSLAGDYGITILIVHHLRKGDAEDILDMVSGSTGLTGGMDGAMVLNRTRSAADGILKAVHRDLEDDPEIALQKVEASEGWWKYAGDAEEYRLGKERREILDVLTNADGPMRPMDIAELLNKKSNSISQALGRMKEDGYVDTVGYAQYVIAPGMAPPPKLDTSQSSHTSHSVILDSKVNGEVRQYDQSDKFSQEEEEIEWLD